MEVTFARRMTHAAAGALANCVVEEITALVEGSGYSLKENSKRKKDWCANAYALIELLVVINVIASLAALRLPALSHAYNAWGIVGLPTRAFPLGLGLGGGNGVNAGVSPRISTRSTPEFAVRAPSDMIAVGDEFIRSRNPALDGMMSWDSTIGPATHYASGLVYDSKTPPKMQFAFKAHHGRANRSFVDGHLESEDMRRPFA